MTSTGDITACVQVISTAICTCWTSLVTRVINVGAPKVVNSRADRVMTLWNRSRRTSRPTAIDDLDPK